MRGPLAIHATLLVVTSALSAGCHRSSVQTSNSVPAQAEEDHCWWAAFRTKMTPDSVAVRYADAYTKLGLASVRWAQLADTAWAKGGPTVLSRPGGTGAVVARVVAYRRGDTTLVRPFVSVRPTEPTNVGSLLLSFCGDAIREAKAQTTAPRDEEPDDSSPVWRRRPTP
jgi:hypothetical protein